MSIISALADKISLSISVISVSNSFNWFWRPSICLSNSNTASDFVFSDVSPGFKESIKIILLGTLSFKRGFVDPEITIGSYSTIAET